MPQHSERMMSSAFYQWNVGAKVAVHVGREEVFSVGERRMTLGCQQVWGTNEMRRAVSVWHDRCEISQASGVWVAS